MLENVAAKNLIYLVNIKIIMNRLSKTLGLVFFEKNMKLQFLCSSKAIIQ